MFTGIIEEIGSVSSVTRKGKGMSISITLKRAFKDIQKGDSIAVNGVCLTVTSLSRNSFSADVSEETSKVSSFSDIKVGQKVNLERALSISKRLGGHIMSGHIDSVITLKGKIARDEGYEFLFKVPPSFKKYIVTKGSVGIDGISLTVSSLTNDGFAVVVIPHTASSTTLLSKQIGEKLNLEVDILSKYVESLLAGDPMTNTEKVLFNSGFLPIGIMEN